MKKTKRPEDRLPIRVLYMVNAVFTRIYHHLRILTPPQLPREGPAIIVSNHISPLDPLLIQSASPHRLINWMMAKEYMTIPAMGRIFKVLEVIPVDRGSRETGPLRAALRGLADGRVIGIFPEGGISSNGELLDFQTGVALMAIKAKVPVYPVYLDGTQRNKEMKEAFFKRSSSVLAFGPAVEFNRDDTSREGMEVATQAIRSSVKQLKIAVDAYQNRG